MEDETGIANIIVTPQMYERNQVTVTRSRFLLVEGPLQNQDNVIHVKAARLTPSTTTPYKSTPRLPLRARPSPQSYLMSCQFKPATGR